MAPAFGLAEVKGLLPYFMDSTTKACELCFHLILKPNSSLCHQMADKWNDIIENSESGYSAVVDANMWLGKAALDTYVPVSTLSLWAADQLHLKDRGWSFRLRLWRIGRSR